MTAGRVRVAAAAMAAAVAGHAGCATVPPWQRETLAHRCMRPELDPDEAAQRDHMLAVREGSRGLAQGAAAGCGCD